MINLEELGTNYNVVTEDKRLIKTVKVIHYTDILESIGIYGEEEHGNFGSYIEQSKQKLSGFVEDPLSVYWHVTSQAKYELSDVIDTSVLEGYDYVIVEIIPEELIDNPWER